MKIKDAFYPKCRLIAMFTIYLLIFPGIEAQDTLKALKVFQRDIPWNVYKNRGNSFYKLMSEYFIWNGVRALDYLETRKEVDIRRFLSYFWKGRWPGNFHPEGFGFPGDSGVPGRVNAF